MHLLHQPGARAGLPGLIEPCVGPFAVRARKRIAIGPDSLAFGGGQPGLAQRLQAHFNALYGDPGPGFIPLDHATLQRSLADGDFALSNGFSAIAALPWSDPLRRRALFGKGLRCRNSDTDDASATDYLLLSSASASVTAVDLYFEWTAAGQSFRLRQWPSDSLASAVLVSQADFPGVGQIHRVTLLMDVGGVHAGKGVNVERVVCQGEDVCFWAVEFHEAAAGGACVQVIDLAGPGVSVADWSAMDDGRARVWAQLLQADVFLLAAGVSDRGEPDQDDFAARAAVACFSGRLSRVISRLQACPRTCVALARAPDTADAADTALRLFDRALKAAATAHGCAFFDERDFLGDFAAAAAAGYMDADGVPPSAAGNARRAEGYLARLARFG